MRRIIHQYRFDKDEKEESIGIRVLDFEEKTIRKVRVFVDGKVEIE